MNDAEVERQARKASASAAAAHRAAAVRDDAIREWWESEHPPLRAIGEAAGLSHTAIAKILKKGQP